STRSPRPAHELFQGTVYFLSAERLPPGIYGASGEKYTVPGRANAGALIMKRLDDIALCFVFFTRLPLPHLDFGGRTLSQAIWAAPLAGLAVALAGSLVYAIAIFSGLSEGIAAALTLA